MKWISLTGLACLLWFSTGAAATDQPGQSPEKIIESTASQVSDRLAGKQDYYAANPDELYELVDEVLLPHFDTRYAGRVVLGRHWKAASNDQRRRFIDVFYRFLVQSYANGVLEFDQGTVQVLDTQTAPDGKRVIVRTSTRMDNGKVIPVNYSMRLTDKGWRVYDMRIDGVSYLQNYRNQFNAEIQALGIEAVIDRLNAEVEKAKQGD